MLRAQAGFTLLEALVSIVIFSVGILGLVGLQARAMQYSVDADDRNRAALLANELVATMWSHKTPNLPAPTLGAWQARVGNAGQGGLPNGVGSVSVGSGGLVAVTITWTPPSRSDQSRYQTQVVMP